MLQPTQTKPISPLRVSSMARLTSLRFLLIAVRGGQEGAHVTQASHTLVQVRLFRRIRNHGPPLLRASTRLEKAL